jgi:hypothetical protein
VEAIQIEMIESCEIESGETKSGPNPHLFWIDVVSAPVTLSVEPGGTRCQANKTEEYD